MDGGIDDQFLVFLLLLRSHFGGDGEGGDGDGGFEGVGDGEKDGE